MFLKEFMLSLGIAALLEPKRESKPIEKYNKVDQEANREIGTYWRQLSRMQETHEKKKNYYIVHIKEEPGRKKIILSLVEENAITERPVYSDIQKAINKVKELQQDYLISGFEVETHLDLSGKINKEEGAIVVCPNCHIGVSAKIWDAYTAKVEGYNLEEMFGLSQRELAKHKEFETQYRCPTCHSEVAGAILLG